MKGPELESCDWMVMSWLCSNKHTCVLYLSLFVCVCVPARARVCVFASRGRACVYARVCLHVCLCVLCVGMASDLTCIFIYPLPAVALQRRTLLKALPPTADGSCLFVTSDADTPAARMSRARQRTSTLQIH